MTDEKAVVLGRSGPGGECRVERSDELILLYFDLGSSNANVNVRLNRKNALLLAQAIIEAAARDGC